MQIGDREALDAARHMLRDQFDAVWQAVDEFGPKERRAIKCAIKLANPDIHHTSPNWTIFPGGRACGDHNRVIYA